MVSMWSLWNGMSTGTFTKYLMVVSWQNKQGSTQPQQCRPTTRTGSVSGTDRTSPKPPLQVCAWAPEDTYTSFCFQLRTSILQQGDLPTMACASMCFMCKMGSWSGTPTAQDWVKSTQFSDGIWSGCSFSFLLLSLPPPWTEISTVGSNGTWRAKTHLQWEVGGPHSKIWPRKGSKEEGF
jgi:hypothetical protein